MILARPLTVECCFLEAVIRQPLPHALGRHLAERCSLRETHNLRKYRDLLFENVEANFLNLLSDQMGKSI